ncbi:hypothetical protein Cni_G18201 [Canna indica]|uniref:Uncharacterized protein n=1 Tax=Canna indica TaxID=4628 RepID=A0AAQ3QHG4_9LILI|nr:hypothetical protein Cni_G18201 [Canna indica]
MAPLRIATAPPDGESAIVALTRLARVQEAEQGRVQDSPYEVGGGCGGGRVLGLRRRPVLYLPAEHDKILMLPRNLSDLHVLINIWCFVLLLSFGS